LIPSLALMYRIRITVYQRGLVIDSQQDLREGIDRDSISKGIGD